MTRQDFELIAKVLADGRSLWGREPVAAAALDFVTRRLAAELSATNPKFNEGRFIKAAEGATS